MGEDVRGVPVWIYALVDPRDGIVRYVGKSHAPGLRFAMHLSDRAAPNVRRWVAELKLSLLVPRLEMLAMAPPGHDAEELEGTFIAMHSRTILNVLTSHGGFRHGRRYRRAGEHQPRIDNPSEGCRLLREWRAAQRLSQQELADLAGVMKGSIGQYEFGRVKPRIEAAMKIAAVTGGAVPVEAWTR